MDYEEVRQFILQWVEENTRILVGEEAAGLEFSDDLNLVAGGVIDSLEFLNLLAAVEERFGVEVDLSETEPTAFSTPAGLANAVVQSGSCRD